MTDTKFHIVFRTCDVVHSLHQTPRPFGLDKRTLIKVCFLSLLESLKGVQHRITILGDRLSNEMLSFFQQFDCTILNEELGNDRSIFRSVQLACESGADEWVYLCEDDYLHTPNAFECIVDLIRNRDEYLKMRSPIRFRRGSERFRDVPLIIHPADYPDRYRRHERRFSLLFLGSVCHWRQISNTTFTILASASTFQQYRSLFERASKGAQDGYLSEHLYGSHFFGQKALAVSPIPGVATHMHEEVMTPLVNWKELVKRYSIQLELQPN
jgi:hypothetical protein